VSTSAPAIRLDSVSLRYRVPLERIPSFKEYAIRWIRRDLHFQDFWAVRDVSLQVDRGEVLGVVGANGAGKSTLLKVIARVIAPAAGRVRVWGRVAPLLELGAGFDYELTGRENVYLNGTILGLSRREVRSRVDGIFDFAGIGEFADAPVRTYSSGMVARLGFAIATSADAAILLVDEVLSVGDAEFRRRSAERIEAFRRQGTAIVVVSHDPDAIRRLCTRAVRLERGAVVADGPVAGVLDRGVAQTPPAARS
jgi:ABC-2 type transport system ATP-binding protein/lipopolysaccharide transport system ATP-binding protein